MKTLTIRIELENDAMQTVEDISDALRALCGRLDEDGVDSGQRWPIIDANGNTVGHAEVREA